MVSIRLSLLAFTLSIGPLLLASEKQELSMRAIACEESGSANCEPQTVGSAYLWGVVNYVEAKGWVYKVSCVPKRIHSSCGLLNQGEFFDVIVEGHTMWISGRKGGNQGPESRMKVTILDIRPLPKAHQ